MRELAGMGEGERNHVVTDAVINPSHENVRVITKS